MVVGEGASVGSTTGELGPSGKYLRTNFVLGIVQRKTLLSQNSSLTVTRAKKC